jgi:hypothetical protein
VFLHLNRPAGASASWAFGAAEQRGSMRDRTNDVMAIGSIVMVSMVALISFDSIG